MGGNGNDWSDLFDEGDPFEDPLWREAELMAKAPPLPAKGYVTCPLVWLARVRPLVRSADQLLVLQIIYRRCLMSRSATVALPNSEIVALGISRYTKYRLLAWLQGAGAATVETRNGQVSRVTLHWFP